MKQIIANRIKKLLKDNNGELTTTAVLEDARDPESPLHGEFNWDTKDAAEKYRLYQARNLIKKYNVIVSKPEQKLYHVPIIHVDKKTGREGKYKLGAAIVKQESEYERAMSQALGKLSAAQRAAVELKELAEKQGQDTVIARLAVALTAMQTAEISIKSIIN